jgi:glycosyltransferase involved in cell wall biosynthesis
MNRPIVSAIMPAYNAEEFLEASLASVLDQDYDSFELVVCDDGSTDRTPEILAAHPQVRTIRQAHAGAAAARNAAVAAARGELVAFFDADDLWPRNRLALQATYLAGNPETACVLGRQEWMNPPTWLTRDAVYGDLDGIPILSAMLRRSVFDEVGGFDSTFTHSEDMDLLFRLRERGVGIHVLPQTILYRRFHGGNLTASAPETSPLLRSLRQKLERERATREES